MVRTLSDAEATKLHRILRRQLRKVGAGRDDAPEQRAWRRLLRRIDAHYRAADEDRYTLLRSIDISSREMEALHATVHEERAQLAALFEAMPQGLLVVDHDDRVRQANPAMARLIGTVPEAGSPLSDYVKLVDASGRQLSPSAAMSAAHCELIGPDAVTRPVDVEVVEIPEVGDLLTFTDLTERLAQRQAVERARVEAEVARRAEQARADFLANMSHELRTPLNAILGYAELLGDDLDDEEATRDLQRIHSAGHHLLGLINDILDLSKVDAGHMQVEMAPVDLDRLVADVVRDLQPIAARHDTRIQRHGTLGHQVLLDATRVRQCLYNLLANACNYTHDGRVDVRLEQHADRLRLSVADTGEGIASDQLETIFQPFRQTRSSRGGTGLGLALVRSLSELMGGSVRVDSTLGEGSTFTLELPHDPASEADAATS